MKLAKYFVLLLLPVILITTCNGFLQDKKDEASQVPNIYFPGPDTVNFPNSPFTLPKSWFYFENFPLTWLFKDSGDPMQYNWFFLLRYGLIRNVEFRIYSNGLTKTYLVNGNPAIIGFSPLVVGLKIHLFGDTEVQWVPAFGFEFYLQTKIASKCLRDNYQPILNFLFNHEFPKEFKLEWNIGVYGRTISENNIKRNLYGLVEWAFEKSFHRDFLIFTQGYYATPCRPQFPSELVIGGGVQIEPNSIMSIWGSVNWSLLRQGNPLLIYAGCAFAF